MEGLLSTGRTPSCYVTYQAVVTEDVEAVALVVTVPVFPAVPGVGVKAGARKAAVKGVPATVGVLARVHGRRLYYVLRNTVLVHMRKNSLGACKTTVLSVQEYSVSPHAVILTRCM